MSEHTLQVGCVKWFRMQYPQYAMNLFAIPNGGLRNKRVAQKLKAEGVVAGVADLFLAMASSELKEGITLLQFGLFVEMKLKPNKPTKKQLEFKKVMENSGYAWEAAYTFEQFKEIIEKWIQPPL